MIKELDIVSDNELYKSFFDSTSPVQIMAFNTLTPGETGDIYIMYRLNRSLFNTYFSDFFKIPIYLRIEFNENMSAYFCHVSHDEFTNFASYNMYTFNNGVRSRLGYQYP